MFGLSGRVRLHSMVFFLSVALFALLANACGPGQAPSLPDAKYVYGPSGAPLPEGAQIISETDFAQLYTDGQIALTGPEAESEADARAQKQDEDDAATIDMYQRLNPNAGPILPELVLPGDGSVTLTDGGNFNVKVRQTNQQLPAIHMTLGSRFRLRNAAGSIRSFGTQANQLATYSEFYTNLPADVRQRLQLVSLDQAGKLTAAELLALNNTIAINGPGIIANLPQVFVPVLPPSCDGDEGAGLAGDRLGNSASCGYSANGLMKNYNWSGKEHISCVKNQAVRGTCPVFSTVSTMEYKVHEKYGRRVNLSEQALYARMKLIWGGGQNFGDGFWPDNGFNSSLAEGYLMPFENQWDYNPSTARINIMGLGPDGIAGTKDDPITGYKQSCDGYSETCSQTAHQAIAHCVISIKGTFCGYHYPDINPNNLGFRVASGATNYWDAANRDLSVAKAILAVALFRSPVIWSFDVEDSSWTPDGDGFVHYASGTENANHGGHAVHVVGYITNTQLAQVLPNAPAGSGGGYFIAKNSWSNCWGDSGFAYIPANSVRDYSTQLVSAPAVQ